MNESKIAAIIIIAFLLLIPIGFIVFGSIFLSFAPILIILATSAYLVITLRRKQLHIQKMKKMRDDYFEERVKELNSDNNDNKP
jgi:hypothetical protein